MKEIAFILVLASVIVAAGCIMTTPTSEGGPYASREARQEVLLKERMREALEERQEAVEERQEALEERREAVDD
jgi:hypothetical protein